MLFTGNKLVFILGAYGLQQRLFMGFIQNHLFCGSVTCLNTLVWNNQAGRNRLYMYNEL